MREHIHSSSVIVFLPTKKENIYLMKNAKSEKTYKSPTRKLARFFEKSRNNWKRKYKEAKKTVRYLKDKVSSLEKSRDNWKKKAQEANAKLASYEFEEKKRNSRKAMK